MAMPLLLPPLAVLAGVAIYLLLTPSNPPVGPPPGKSGALVWGDGIFANQAQLSAWLKLRGVLYRVWLRQHPAAVKLLTARTNAPKQQPTKPKPHLARPAQPKPPENHTPTSAPTLSTSAGGHSYLVGFMEALVLVLLGVAIVPQRFLTRDNQVLISSEARMMLATGGLAVLVGCAVALWIG